jgi:energy-coupling factor transporter ATP-binding protein EcfA2
MQVLEDLDMVHRKDVPVRGLSGGQQKRVSIGVELLTEPGLFFLDEPTSGLDPGTETAFMHLMRRLADQGRTIVLVTHATKNVMLADKVVFLARGGHLAWFGPPDEALQYFNQYRTDRERQSGSMEFDKIYSILDDTSKGGPEDWSTRYQQHPAYQTHILQPLSPKAQQLVAQKRTRPKKKPKGQRQVSSLRQFIILSQRNLKILTRDRTSLILMLTAAPLVSMLDVLLAFLMGNDLFNFDTGSMENLIMVFFLLVIFAVFVGGLSQMREIVKEAEIYRRERLVNLKIFPYVYSKVWIAGAFALYHGGAYTVIHYLAYEMPGGTMEFIQLYITMALLAFGGMMLGLFVSALAPNANTAPMLVILFLMPQVVLSGALVPLPGSISSVASTRWGFEAMMAITGSGSDVAADQCWALPEELRDAMSLDEKNAQCNCLGVNAVRQESCDFPGIGQFYQAALDEPEPIQPEDLPPQPTEPVIPPAPTQPADQSDQVAMAEYFQEVQDYQDEVAVIQDGYKAEMNVYQAQAEIYRVEMTAYQEEKTEWEVSRTAAIEPAEGFIKTFYDDYGWTFVDKDDSGAYLNKLTTTWVAQIIILNVLIVGVLILVKRKDVI